MRKSEKEGALRTASSVIISMTRLASVVPRSTTRGYLTTLPHSYLQIIAVARLQIRDERVHTHAEVVSLAEETRLRSLFGRGDDADAEETLQRLRRHLRSDDEEQSTRDLSQPQPPVESGEEIDAAEVQRGGGEEEILRLGEEASRFVLDAPGAVERVESVEHGVEEVEELAGRAAQHILQRPRAQVASRHDGLQLALAVLVEEQQRTLEERVEQQREEFSVLGEDELAGGAAGAALRAILREDVLDGGLEVLAQLGEAERVALDGGGAGERHGDGGAVDALEELGEGVGGLVLLVEDADAATALVVGEGAVKETKVGLRGLVGV